MDGPRYRNCTEAWKNGDTHSDETSVRCPRAPTKCLLQGSTEPLFCCTAEGGGDAPQIVYGEIRASRTRMQPVTEPSGTE